VGRAEDNQLGESEDPFELSLRDAREIQTSQQERNGPHGNQPRPSKREEEPLKLIGKQTVGTNDFISGQNV